jgi:hypothetical protein
MQASRWHHVPPPFPAGTPTGVWGPNLKIVHRYFCGPNHQTVWRRVSTTAPPRSWHVSPSSMTTQSPRPLAPLLDMVNTVYSSSCALAGWCLQVSATMVSLPVILIPRSKPRVHPSPFPIHGTTHLYLTFSITVDHLYAPHLTTTQLTFRRSPKMPLVSAISASGTIPTGTKSPSPMALLSGAVERDVWCHRPGLQLLSWSVAPIRTIGLALVPVSVTNRD